MVLETVIEQIISLVIVALIGFYGGKKKIIDEKVSNGLTRILLEISVPLLIISSFNFKFTSEFATNIKKAFLYSLVIFVLTPLFVKPLLLKVDKSKKNILQFSMVFSNCGFMGFPLASCVFGAEGVVYASIFNMFFNLFIWTYGIMLFSDVKSFKEVKKVLKNPGIISAVIGLVIMIFSINIHPVILNTMKMVGSLTTPMSMLIIGSLLSRTNFRNHVKDITIYYGALIKLIVIPVAIYIVAGLFKESSIVMKTLILMQAMPVAAMASMFAENYNKNREYSAVLVSFSTLLCVFTIPLIIKLCF
jgi:Predicted permeases